MLGLVGCGDDPSSPTPSTPADEDNQSTTGDINATPSIPPKTWFGPPADTDAVLALRLSAGDATLHGRLSAWVVAGLDRNVTIPDPLALHAFSRETPVYIYLKGTETGMVGHTANTSDGNFSLPGFTIATEGNRRVIVSGDSSESSARAKAILAGQDEVNPASNLSSFADAASSSAAALYLPNAAIGIDLHSASGAFVLTVGNLRPGSSSPPPAKNTQWNIIPAETAAFFGSTRSGTLIEPVANFVLGRIYADLDIEHNASHSWTESLARLLDSRGTPGQAFENLTGGTLFSIAPPDENNSSTPFPIPAELKESEAMLLVDFPRLGSLLRSDFSSMLDRPTVVLALERAKRLTIRGDSNSVELRLTWMNQTTDGLSSLSAFLEELSRRLKGRSFYEAVLQDDLATVRKLLDTTDFSALNLAGDISPLHFAAWQGKLPVLAICLEQGIQVDLLDEANRTALHMAAWSGNPEAAQFLLDHNASVDLPNNIGATPMMEAARIGNPSTLDLLLSSGADLNASDIRGSGLVEYAASGGHKALVAILKKRGSTNHKPLHVAAGIGDLTALNALAKDANATNATDGWGATPLLYAAKGGQAKAFAHLLAKKADPRAKDEQGLTLVHAAAISGNSEILAKTLTFGLDVNARHAERGATPLDWAIARKDGLAVDTLRAAGAKTGWQLEIAH